jgi:Zn-finger nucleic acid-binding protein
MPLLVCPNDSANMQTLNRSGVEFDFCPTCRGIWLDRGELEKLMAAARDDGYRRKRRRGLSIFDIFD